MAAGEHHDATAPTTIAPVLPLGAADGEAHREPGGPEGIRTPDPLAASQVLYRTELRARGGVSVPSPLDGARRHGEVTAPSPASSGTIGASRHSRSSA